MSQVTRRWAGKTMAAVALLDGWQGFGNAPHPARGDDSPRGRRDGPQTRPGVNKSVGQLEGRARELRHELERRGAAALRHFGAALRNLGRLELPLDAEEVLAGSGLYKVPVHGCPRGTALVGAQIHKSRTGQWSVTISGKVEGKILGIGGELGGEGEYSRATTRGVTVELKEGCLVLDEKTRMSNDARQMWEYLFQEIRGIADTYNELKEVERAIEQVKKTSANGRSR